MRFVVLGGYGSMGRVAVKDMYDTCKDAQIVIAGRELEKARAYADHFDSRVIGEQVDVHDADQLNLLLSGADAVLNCTNYYYNIDVMEAALRAGTNYLDLGGLFHMTKKQLQLHYRFKEAGKLAILGCGSTPGISNVLAGYGSEVLEQVHEVHISFGAHDFIRHKEPFVMPYTAQTLFDEFTLQPAVYAKGKLKMVKPLTGMQKIAFSSPIGKLEGFYSLHSELATMPDSFKHLGIRECSFRVTFPKAFVEQIRFLIGLGFASREEVSVNNCSFTAREVAAKILDRLIPSKANDIECIRVEMIGATANRKKKLLLECTTRSKHGFSSGAYDTGVPISIMAQMLAKGTVKQKGVLPPESCIDARTFFDELKRRGFTIRIRGK